MTRRTLCIATILGAILSFLLFPAPVSRAQDRLTQAEVVLAKETADLFLKRLDETGDFSSVIDEMYAKDFIERYVQQQIREGKESTSPSDIYFAPGLEFKRDLLNLATKKDLRTFYTAFHNFLYQFFATGLNKHADDLLKGREGNDEWMDEKIIPPSTLALLNKQPALKGFFGLDYGKPAEGDTSERSQSNATERTIWPKPIETLEEMQSVTETFQESLRLMLEEHGNHLPRLTESGKSALEVVRLKHTGDMEPRIEIRDKEFLGVPPGTRILCVPTPFMFWMFIAEVNGKQTIIWAQFLVLPSHI
jgi:hypothetical protein